MQEEEATRRTMRRTPRFLGKHTQEVRLIQILGVKTEEGGAEEEEGVEEEEEEE